jgi:redox-sensitive bicupin YhaK (pirin superfamily)
MTLSRWALTSGEQGSVDVEEGRRIWIQVVKGEVSINGTKATTADGLAVWDEQALSVHADSESEILLFDLPPV